jgi:hypothetical protein
MLLSYPNSIIQVLFCSVLFCSVLLYSTLFYSVDLEHSLIYCTALHCTALHCPPNPTDRQHTGRAQDGLTCEHDSSGARGRG